MDAYVKIYPQERVDDLQCSGLRIIQDPAQFCFGIDAVLLSHFAAAAVKPGAQVLDLCSGNGIVALLLSAKTRAAHISTLELQEGAADLARRSVRLNGLTARITVHCGDAKDSVALFGKNRFDCISCNPPYKEAGGGLVNAADALTLARHETSCTLQDLLERCAALLKPGGKLCLVHRPERLVDLIALMRALRLEPKRLCFVHPSPRKKANLILVEGVRNGRPKLFLDAPLYIYEETGAYSTQIEEIYGRKGEVRP